MWTRKRLLRLILDNPSYLYLACGHASNNACLFVVQTSGAQEHRTLQVRGLVNMKLCPRDGRQ